MTQGLAIEQGHHFLSRLIRVLHSDLTLDATHVWGLQEHQDGIEIFRVEVKFYRDFHGPTHLSVSHPNLSVYFSEGEISEGIAEKFGSCYLTWNEAFQALSERIARKL